MFTEKRLIKNIYNGHRLYRTVTVPPTFDEVTINGLTWMSKNLAIDDGEGGIYTHTYDYGQGSITEYYYTWDAAVRIASKIEGWHLPSREEWVAIAGPDTSSTETYGRDLKSTYGWYNHQMEPANGIDTYGFTVLPAGDRTPGDSWVGMGFDAYFWTADAQSSTAAHFRNFNAGDVVLKDWGYKTYAYSVRLVKD